MSTGFDGRKWADLFAEIARAFEVKRSPQAVLAEISASAVRYVPGCDHCGISLVRNSGQHSTEAATDDVPTRVDQIQYLTGQGPTLDAIHDQETVLVTDLSTDGRWPEFGPRAFGATGVRSMLAVRLFTGADTIGALTLYSQDHDALTSDAQAIAAILATHAAIAILGSRERALAENLLSALTSSREIGIAIGVLMAQGHQNQADAFQMLGDASQRLNIKVRELAPYIIESGELDENAVRRSQQHDRDVHRGQHH